MPQRSYELVWRLPPAGLRRAWRPLVLVIGLAVHVEAASLFGRLAPGSAEGPCHIREVWVWVASAGLLSLCIRVTTTPVVTVNRVPTAGQGGVLPSVAGAAAKLSAPGWTEGADSAWLRKAGRR